MQATTTIRVERDVHQRLAAVSRESGRPLMDVVRDATEALERIRFAARVAVELDELREDAVAWSEYLADAELAVGDGIS